MNTLTLTSPDFEEGGRFPRRHTGQGEDLSPAFQVRGLPQGTAAMALVLEDASHPLFRNYTHWLIWDLPPSEEIPGAISPGERVDSLGGAVQGTAYGRSRYRGPKPPLGLNHRYVFTLYALDQRLDLSPSAKKQDLLRAMEGHILGRSTLSGWFQSGRG